MGKSSGGKHDGGGSHAKKYDANKEAKGTKIQGDGQGKRPDPKNLRDPKMR